MKFCVGVHSGVACLATGTTIARWGQNINIQHVCWGKEKPFAQKYATITAYCVIVWIPCDALASACGDKQDGAK